MLFPIVNYRKISGAGEISQMARNATEGLRRGDMPRVPKSQLLSLEMGKNSGDLFTYAGQDKSLITAKGLRGYINHNDGVVILYEFPLAKERTIIERIRRILTPLQPENRANPRSCNSVSDKYRIFPSNELQMLLEVYPDHLIRVIRGSA